jgi:hypothetical protein
VRPHVDRPLIRGLQGRKGSLSLEFSDGRAAVDVASRAFSTVIADLRVVAVEFELGTFLIISERRTRGGRYWVARAYHDGRRASVYLGREFGEREVREAADRLTERLAEVPVLPPDAPIDDVVRDLLDRERDPARRAAAEAIAAMVRRAPPRRDRPT